MNDNIIIQQIKDKDKIKNFFIEEDNSFLEKLSSRVDIEEYTDKLINNAVIYSIQRCNKIIAIIAYYRNNLNNKTAYLTYLCVDKLYRSNNYATKLLSIMFSDCINNGFLKIRLETNKDNLIARKFYEKNGFKLYEQKNNSVFYEKILKNEVDI